MRQVFYIITYYFFLFFMTYKYVLAQDEASAFQNALNQNLNVQTKEATVFVDGIEYRQIEIDHKNFYLQFMDGGEKVAAFCGDPTKASGSTRLIKGAIKVFRRNRIFIEGLRAACSEVRPNHYRVELQPDILIGVHFGDDKKDLIKNKSIGISPLGPLPINFRGEW